MRAIRNIVDRFCQHEPAKEDLGLSLQPGDPHYRAFVGPPEDYDLIAAMTFNLLTTLGLRQHHTILDVGCGSLRVGRLLIPYLNAGHYTGIEPNGWLVDQGVQHELGQDQLKIKLPKFHLTDSVRCLPSTEMYDFVVAQSVFSHCGSDLLNGWLKEISDHVKDSGALVATFLMGEHDCPNSGWIYPGCVCYKAETMRVFAQQSGFRFFLLDWKHPRQTWALYGKPDFDVSWFQGRPLTWNTMLDFAPKPVVR